MSIGFLKDIKPVAIFNKASLSENILDTGETRTIIRFNNGKNGSELKRQGIVFYDNEHWQAFRDFVLSDKTGRYGLALYENNYLSKFRIYLIDFHSSNSIIRIETFLEHKLAYEKKSRMNVKKSNTYQALK